MYSSQNSNYYNRQYRNTDINDWSFCLIDVCASVNITANGHGV